MKSKKRILLSLVSLCVITNSSLFASEEGGYVDRRVNPTFVYNFLKHFNYEQYYWSANYMWTNRNNYYVDNMDFAFYGGHGSPFHHYGENVDLTRAGYSSHKGYGDRDAEFITFYSCKVVPSPIEKPGNRWATPWTQKNGVFDGLHMVTGFRTNAYIAPSEAVANKFGLRVASHQKVKWAWFNAIWEHGNFRNGNDRGSVVFHPSASEDRYPSRLADPNEHHQDLAIVYLR